MHQKYVATQQSLTSRQNHHLITTITASPS